MNRKMLLAFAAVLVVACGASFWIGTIWTDGSPEPGAPPESEVTTYYCSMHPHITLPHPGTCSICPMDLIPMKRADRDLGPRCET